MKYIEMSIDDAMLKLSDYRDLFLFFVDDPKYVVRVYDDGAIEVGYPSDPEWPK
jgi:hypothetical protein